jgi:hypothetical protein
LVGLLAALAGTSKSDRRAVISSTPQRPQRASGVVTYRSRDGSTFFRFRFSPMGGGEIRIHILEFPNPSVGSCHVLHDGDGPYICWSGSIGSSAEAKAVAAIWAEATIVYQRQGRAF